MFNRFIRSIRLLSLVILITGAACAPVVETPAPGPEPDPADPTAALWTVTEGIETPESVYVDPVSGSIFVSQIAGDPGTADGNGWIVQLSMDGTVMNAEWATGLNAPKGLRSFAGVLWTADINEVIGWDIASGDEVERITVDGAMFLNDVAAGEDGSVYVSDFMANRIYRIEDGEVSVFAEGADLEFPNGLLVDGGRLIVGAWGEPAADFSTEVPGRLYALDLETAEKTLITPEPFANIDGVESDGSGGWIITDYLAGKVIRVAPDGTYSDLAQFMPGTADHAYVAANRMAILPHMNENQVSAYDLSGMLE